MQAILVKDGKGPIENLYFGERPIPELRKDYVLVKACLSDCSRSLLYQQVTTD